MVVAPMQEKKVAMTKLLAKIRRYKMLLLRLWLQPRLNVALNCTSFI